MAGVYVSIPFCSQKCTYCNFASGVFPPDLEAAYLEALHAEIVERHWRWRPETVYLGGGTPSLINAAALAGLLAAIPGAPWKEATIEAAPGTVAAKAARAWREAGITRASLGVQSFVEAEIRRTRRKHTPSTVAEDVATLRRAGIERINIDLIAGLPGQTTASWLESLDWIERLAPDHVSVYMLDVDEDSRLGLELLRGGSRYGAGDVPADDAIGEMYETAVEWLAKLGLRRYEISNFARPGSESLHNLKYWRLEPYAGFGADAHSFDGVLRWPNVETAAEYVGRWRRGESPRLETSAADPDAERFFVGLRLSEGVRPRAEEWRRFDEAISRFIGAGLIESDGGTLRLTPRGVLLSNEVFQEFIPA